MKPNNVMPRQRRKESQKTDQWHQDTMDAIFDLCEFNPGQSNFREELRKCYDYFNGIIDDADYTHVLNPYGKRRPNLPAKLHNYPIIRPVITLLQGEKRRRPFNYSVVVANGDVTNRKNEELSEVMRQNLEQLFVNEVAMAGMSTGMEQEETPLPQKVADDFLASYRDARAVRGQQALNYLEYAQNLRGEMAKAWKHWLISGIVVSKRDVIADEVIYQTLNPLHVDFDKSEDTDYIEDGDWAVERKRCTRASVIDSFYEYLSQGQIDALETVSSSYGSSLDFSENTIDKKPGNIEVLTFYWKCQKRIGLLSYIDENGELQEDEVPDGYQAQEGEKIEWLWVNEVREGTRINEDIYIKMRAYPVQRESLDNRSSCKLPINGRKYSDLNSPNISILMLGVPYQLSYNIYRYRLDTAIAKSKDVIAQLDLDMIPEGWDMDKWMYYVDATGIAWSSYSKEGISPSPHQKAVIDMSIKTINDFITLLESVKAEWYELAGVSRQRLGAIAQYDGRDTTQQAIVQSAMITEELFALFAEFEQKDLQALMDLSRYAWINGKKGMYLGSDQTEQILDIDGVEHMDAEYGIFVSDSARDQEKVEMLRTLTQSFAQNGAPMSAVIEMVEATNFVSLKDKMKKAEESMQQLQQAQAEAEQAQAEADLQLKVNELDRTDMNKALDRQNNLDVEMLRQEAQATVSDRDSDGIPDDSESLSKERQQMRQLELEREKLRQDKTLTNRKLDIDEKKNQMDAEIKRIAARKKPTSGSK